MSKVLASRDSLSARYVLQFYFRQEPLGSGTGDYFIHRVGQPRFLAALAVASTLAPDEKPILDVACGLGHLDHYLTCRGRRSPVIGIDMNFYHVWIAKHWIAPSAQYACCNVSDGLPFCDEALSAVVVSDAYHYLPMRDRFNAEVKRVAPGRPMLLTRVGNSEVMPNEGSESSLAGYLGEIGGRQIRVFSEESLVRDYLLRRNPLGRQDELTESLERCKWLTFVCNPTAEASAVQPEEEPYPHSVGRIGVNPIYRSLADNGRTRLTFQFPAPWFAYENHQMLEYHPRRAMFESADRTVLEAGGWNDSLERLLKQFVLVGLPERY